MSLLKSVLSYIISALFVLSLYLAITSYTIGNLIQKEKIESFIHSQINETIIPQTCEDTCNTQYQQSCEEQCNSTNITESCNNACLNSPHNLEIKQGCIQTCLSRSNSSQQYISKTIDEFYSKKIC